MGKSRILVVQLKELAIFTGIILFIILILVVGIKAIKDKKEDIATMNNNDDSSLEASALNYVPGVYTCEVAIDKTILGIEITLDEHHINSVRFTNMTDDINDTYPLLLPTLESIEKQLMADTSPDDVVIGSDSTYTGKLLLDSIENCLTSAKN